MGKYGENDKQGQYWNEAPGQSWVVNDTAMNERLQAISDILFEGLDATGCNNGLDIGCGAGSTTRRLAAIMGNQARVTGLDISEKLLALARSHPEIFNQHHNDLEILDDGRIVERTDTSSGNRE